MPGDEHLDLDSLMNNGMVSITSNNNHTPNTVSIFPNPTKDRFTISLHQNCKEAKLEIYTLDGKLIFLKDHISCGDNTFSYDVNISGVSDIKKGGIYFCRLFADKEVYYTKLLIQ